MTGKKEGELVSQLDCNGVLKPFLFSRNLSCERNVFTSTYVFPCPPPPNRETDTRTKFGFAWQLQKRKGGRRQFVQMQLGRWLRGESMEICLFPSISLHVRGFVRSEPHYPRTLLRRNRMFIKQKRRKKKNFSVAHFLLMPARMKHKDESKSKLIFLKTSNLST